MGENYTILEVFEYAYEADIFKAKLDSKGIHSVVTNYDSSDYYESKREINNWVKVYVLNEDLEKAKAIYNEVRTYIRDSNGQNIHCPNCNAPKILIANQQQKNLFLRLFPFFESRKLICNDCKTIFK